MKQAIEYIWDALCFPEATHLQRTVTKKQLFEHGALKGRDKKLFQEAVKNIYWEYTLKPSTCQILSYKDDEREYLEVVVLQVKMKAQKGHKRIAEIIHRVIPYPLLIGFFIDNKSYDEHQNEKEGDIRHSSDLFALSVAPKRYSQLEQGAYVVERFFTTYWMNADKLNEHETAFIASLAWSKLPLETYGALYNAWTDRFIGYECAALSGTFVIDKTDNRLEYLTQCRDIESKISELRAQLKKEVFKRQVELNIQIKQLEQKLKQLIEYL